MKTLVVLPILLLSLASGPQFVNSVEEILLSQLASQAEKYLAPFIDTSRERLYGQIFGSGRAARSTDVVLFNKSGKTFKLQGTDCETGGWSSSLFPEYEIPAHSSITYGGESYGLFTGVTECVVKYRSTGREGEAWVEVSFSNPYIGPVLACATGHNVDVKVLLGRGNNNILRVVVEDGDGDSRDSSKNVHTLSMTGIFLRCA